MKFINCFILEIFLWNNLGFIYLFDCKFQELLPKISIGILVRNKAFSLPYFFYYLENLNYDKQRLGIIIFEDHSIDNSGEIIGKWCNKQENSYAFIECVYGRNSQVGYIDELSPTDWSKERMGNVIRLREKILTKSKWYWSDYLFMVDADIILTNKSLLSILIEILLKHEAIAIAPMLNCTSLPFYSNFWDQITNNGLYKRTDRYLNIKNSLIKGTFNVPVIHSAILFNLNHKKIRFLSFEKHGNLNHLNDDVINLAMNAKINNLSFLINNEHIFGFFPGPISTNKNGYYLDKNTFVNLLFNYVIYYNNKQPEKLEFIEEIKQLDIDNYKNFKIAVDEIFVINLQRRKNRNRIIDYMLKTMGIDFRFFAAIDGRSIDKRFILNYNITELNGYSDPFYKRGLKYGEIGCFLSHFSIWKDMIQRNLSRIMILEDDIKCTSEFPFVVNDLLTEADTIYPDWEFFYLGRKTMSSEKEYFINGSKYLLIPNYSYRTTGYILTRNAALKLINENPLEKMIALDEYIPIMYGKSPHFQWVNQFRGHGLLKAIACYPVVVQPTHFKGENGHFSDTEESDLLN